MPAGMLAVYDVQAREMRLHVHAGLSEAYLETRRWPVTGRGDSVTAEAMERGKIRCVADLTLVAGHRDWSLAAEGVRALVCVPLELQGEPVGVLHLYDFEPRQLPQRQLDMLALLATFAVMAINNASLHARTRQMAITDALTGLHNSRYFKQVFPQEMARARRYGKPLSLVMLDIDHFKKINDTYGHPRGDQVLAAVGRVLSGSLRAADYSFRYGGEEFAVLLPEIRLEGAFLAAKNLRERITRMPSPLQSGDTPRPVTVSLGVACYPNDTNVAEQLLKHADYCLYKAKRQGRDRVYWESLQAPPGK